MRPILTALFLIALFLALVCVPYASVIGGQKARLTEYTIRVPKFARLSEKESDKASEQILDGYANLTDDLETQLLQEKVPDEARVYLIYMLGQLREPRAVSSLIKFIDLKAPRRDPAVVRIGRWGEYPAAEALVRVGGHSVSVLLLRLPEQQTKLTRKLMVTVIRAVQGEKCGRATLEKALAEETADPGKANLKASLEAFDALKVGEAK